MKLINTFIALFLTTMAFAQTNDCFDKAMALANNSLSQNDFDQALRYVEASKNCDLSADQQELAIDMIKYINTQKDTYNQKVLDLSRQRARESDQARDEAERQRLIEAARSDSIQDLLYTAEARRILSLANEAMDDGQLDDALALAYVVCNSWEWDSISIPGAMRVFGNAVYANSSYRTVVESNQLIAEVSFMPNDDAIAMNDGQLTFLDEPSSDSRLELMDFSQLRFTSKGDLIAGDRKGNLYTAAYRGSQSSGYEVSWTPSPMNLGQIMQIGCIEKGDCLIAGRNAMAIYDSDSSLFARLQFKGAPIRHIDESPTGDKLLSLTTDNQIALWDESMQLADTVKHNTYVSHALLTLTDELVYADIDGRIFWHSNNVVTDLKAVYDLVTQLEYVPDQDALLVASLDSSIQMINRDAQIINKWLLTSPVVSAGILKNGQIAAVTKGKVYMLDPVSQSQKELFSLYRESNSFQKMTVSPDGNYFATLDHYGDIYLWHNTGQIAAGPITLVLEEVAPIFDVGFSPDGTRLWMHNGSQIELMSVPSLVFDDLRRSGETVTGNMISRFELSQFLELQQRRKTE